MSSRRRSMLPIDAARRAEIESEYRRRRQVQIEAMVADLERRADELDREIVAEENRTGIHDPSYYAYPTYAKSAMIRRDNLRRSAAELRAELQENALVAPEELREQARSAA